MQEAERKGRRKYINILKESILNDATKGGDGDTTNPKNDATGTTTSAITSTVNPITRSSEAYIYSIGGVDVIAIGACVFFCISPKILSNLE